MISPRQSRFAPLFAAAVLAFSALAAPALAAADRKDEGPKISAPHAILIEAEQGSVLLRAQCRRADLSGQPRQADDRRIRLPPAQGWASSSSTDEFQSARTPGAQGGAPSHSSTMFAELHSKVSVDDLLHGMIIQSANDACIALAEGLAGNERAFGEQADPARTRNRAQASTFTNSNGLPDPGKQVTTRELAKLARHIIQTYPEFYKLFGERGLHLEQDPPVQPQSAAQNGIGADGLKTGFTKEAGYGLVGSAVQNGLRLIVVVTGLKTAKERGRRRQEAARMGLPQFRGAHLVRRRPDASAAPRSMAATGPRAAGGLGASARDGAEERRRPAHRAYRLYRAGAGAGQAGPADRRGEGLAQR